MHPYFTRGRRLAIIPIGPSIAYLPLADGNLFALFPRDYVDQICEHAWHTHQSGGGKIYARATIGGKKVYMHRLLSPGDHSQTDHFDGNGMNNLPHNLRPTNAIGNGANKSKYSTNTSGFKGVTFAKTRNKWVAGITINYKHKTLGYFDTPEAAHAAYCEAALRLHGEFARTS